ncbi:MAG: endolytic transglycosylase MltG [Erysipelotrichaceae bacterium]|nr:endolytic transglycosylase MltG [Erysipelotrichaceae bacterium]
MKKKNKKKTIIIIILSLLAVIAALIAGMIIYINLSLKPTDAFLKGKICQNGEESCDVTVFIVDEGAYGKSTLDKLQAQGIIRDSDIVYYYNRVFTGYAFVAGYFELPHQITDENGNQRDITLDEILAFLADPKNAHQDTVTISFDEGDFIREYAKQIGDNTTVTAEEILNYWEDENVIRSYMNEYPFLTEEIFNDNVKYYLEGYLFPDTYEFFEFTNCDEITRKFFDRTLEIYNKHIDEFNASRFSIHEVFTLASIVQWETGDPEDSKLVAGVFVARLDYPEVLGSTVTACYAFDLTKDQCYHVGDNFTYTQEYHPYNTYTVQGLPPGPVCNPNEVAINAALNYDDSHGYFYFCANMCDGGTVFARTVAEHQYNIDNYFLACAS